MLKFLIFACMISVAITDNAYNDDKLQEKIQKLIERTSKDTLLRVDIKDFKEFMKSSPRNYSTILMLTALNEQRGCQVCGPVYLEYKAIAHSWKKSSDYSNKLFLAYADFDNGGMEIFQALKIGHAPVFIHFPPKGKPTSQDQYDMQRRGLQAEGIIQWINERANVNIKLIRPIDISQHVPKIIGGVILLAFLVYAFLKRKNMEFLFNANIWSIIVIAFILAFLSGQTWNSIRTPPFSRSGAKSNKDAFIAGSNQFQYVAESYIVIGLYALIAFGFIIMNEIYRFKSLKYRFLFMCIGLLIVIAISCVLLSIFEFKFGGYPYGFQSFTNINLIDYL